MRVLRHLRREVFPILNLFDLGIEGAVGVDLAIKHLGQRIAGIGSDDRIRLDRRPHEIARLKPQLRRHVSNGYASHRGHSFNKRSSLLVSHCPELVSQAGGATVAINKVVQWRRRRSRWRSLLNTTVANSDVPGDFGAVRARVGLYAHQRGQGLAGSVGFEKKEPHANRLLSRR